MTAISVAPYPTPETIKVNDDLNLVQRATRAAQRYCADHPEQATHHHDWPLWTRRAITAGAIATALDIPITWITISDDPDRQPNTPNRQLYDVIAITEPGTGNIWQFIPDFSVYGSGWLLLDSCPECDKPVPVARVATLIDLGMYLDFGPEDLPHKFFGDWAHQPECDFAAQSDEM